MCVCVCVMVVSVERTRCRIECWNKWGTGMKDVERNGAGSPRERLRKYVNKVLAQNEEVKFYFKGVRGLSQLSV